MKPDVERFWHAYALRRLKRFKRTRGKAYDVEFQCRNGVAGRPSWRALSFRWAHLVQDQDVHNRFPQFGLLCYESLAEALAAVLASPLMNEDNAVNRTRLNLFPIPTDRMDYASMRQESLRYVRENRVSCEWLVDAVHRHTPDAGRLSDFRRTGNGQLLGRERELAFMAMGLFVDESGGVPREFVEILHATVRAYRREHSDVLRAAVWALGRANRKASIPVLVDFLRQAQEGLSFSTGTALQMLCSGSRMIPLPESDSARYWDNVLEKVSDRTPSSWLRHDCKSVFWETRLRSVFAADRKQIDVLREDEVWAVRNAASSIDLVEVRLTDELIRAIRNRMEELSAQTSQSSPVSPIKVTVRWGTNSSFRASNAVLRVLAEEIAREDENEMDLKRSSRRGCVSPELAGKP